MFTVQYNNSCAKRRKIHSENDLLKLNLDGCPVEEEPEEDASETEAEKADEAKMYEMDGEWGVGEINVGGVPEHLQQYK